MTDAPRTSAATLDDLLRRMQQKTDFPALSDAVSRIHSVVNSERESVASLTNEILKDVALTNKLLRMVNSAVYAQHGRINTVSRAVSLVGFDAIRNLALSLVLLEHLQDKAQAGVLKEEYLRSLMAGSLASELSACHGDAEEAFLGSMFQNLGRLLAEFYLPQEAAQVRELMAGPQALSETAASTQVLGLGYESLGLGGARAWGLPPAIQQCMRLPVGTPPPHVPADTGERLRWTAHVANVVADTMLHAAPAELNARIDRVAQRHARTLDLSTEQVADAVVRARQRLVDLAKVMELDMASSPRAARLLAAPPDPAGPDEPQDSLMGALEDQTLPVSQALSAEPQPAQAAAAQPDAASLLAAGIQDVTLAMVDEGPVSDILRMVLETLFRALDFQRVVFALRDPKTGTLVGRFCLGLGVPGGVGQFRVPLADAGPGDVFATVCRKGADTLIGNTADAHLRPRFPTWFYPAMGAGSFLLLPLVVKGRPVGLIYADKAVAGSIVMDDKVLAMARTLRNQALMALKNSG